MDVGDDRAQLLEIGTRTVEVDLRGLGVTQDRPEWLAELVGECGSQLPERSDTPCARELRAQLLELLSGLTMEQESAAQLHGHDDDGDEKQWRDEERQLQPSKQHRLCVDDGRGERQPDAP